MGLFDVEVNEDRTAGLAFVIAPDYRGSGLGRRALHAIAQQLAADGIREVSAVPRPTAASIRCMESAGFARRSDEPDAAGFLYLERHLTNASMVYCLAAYCTTRRGHSAERGVGSH